MQSSFLVFALAGSVSCGDDKPKDAGTFGSGGGGMDAGMAGASGNAAVFKTEDVTGCGPAGHQTTISASGGKVAFATMALQGSETCMTMNGPGTVTNYDICYAESVGGAAFSTTVVVTVPYLSPTGIGLALAPSGEATLAYTGGPPAVKRCGGSDLLVVTGSGTRFGAARTLAEGSMSNALDAGMASECIQNVCNAGDATGFWPAVAMDPSGNALIGFRDMHFGFAFDDFASSDVEFIRGTSIRTVDVARGGGAFLRIASDPSGKAAIAHYNGERGRVNGIWVNRELSDNTWEHKRVTDAKIGEQLGFAISPAGLYAIAYYDDGDPSKTGARLRYAESMDGATWSSPIDVDTDGVIGQYPSLAFAPDGEPAIAYYRCSDYGSATCDQNKDGLHYAKRVSGKWRVREIVAEGGIFDGLYPALAFSAGKAVIAFQARTFDASSAKSALSLHVAREQ